MFLLLCDLNPPTIYSASHVQMLKCVCVYCCILGPDICSDSLKKASQIMIYSRHIRCFLFLIAHIEHLLILNVIEIYQLRYIDSNNRIYLTYIGIVSKFVRPSITGILWYFVQIIPSMYRQWMTLWIPI